MRLLVLWILATSLWSPPEAVWQWPTTSNPQVVRDFDAPDSPWGPGHRGLDVRAKVGERIVAPTSGRIHFSGDVAGRGVVTIRTADGHLVSLEPLIISLEGSTVRRGQTLGRLDAGHCAEGCLHIGLRVDGEYRSPARELGILRRAVLIR